MASELELVAEELRRIIAADFPIIAEVNEHLLRMKESCSVRRCCCSAIARPARTTRGR